jgi:hypothetical protein
MVHGGHIGFGWTYLVPYRVALVVALQHGDIAVEGGGKQEGLSVFVGQVEQGPDFGEEPHVGHTVGFIDDDDLDAVQADSRVGARINAVGLLGFARTERAIAGIPKASVLPEPVGARTATSAPSSESPIVTSCTSKGVWMPRALSDATRSAGTPRSEKEGTCAPDK